MQIRYRNGHTDCERQIGDALTLDEPMALLKRFSTLVRSSGKEDEFTAARYLAERLRFYGIPHEVYEPTLYISLPVEARLQYHNGVSWHEIHCTSPSFSASTAPQGIEATGVLTSAAPRGEADYVFDDTVVDANAEVQGNIAFCEGTFSPAMVRTLEDLGAVGIIMINPGERLHESNCSTIWGTPTLDNMHRLPGVPVVSITHADGDRLRQMVRQGELRLRMRTKMDVGWRRCLMPVAEIRGKDEPESFILVHGHLDSWYYGLCDNATGDACLLELARVLAEARAGLGRSIRIAWWPGHSHGRYAGSTWYADQFAIDLDEHCVAQMNIDSPGARWATSYEAVMRMAEVGDFCQEAIYDAVGQQASGSRPQRAGDYSFNNIGITSMYMLLSSIPQAVREEKGFYKVGGNGGNSISWHTAQDLMEYVDPDILMRDLKVYATTICRLANVLVLPYDFRQTLQTHRERLMVYQHAAGSRFDLGAAFEAIDELTQALEAFYMSSDEAVRSASGNSVAELRRFNDRLLAAARALIPIDYVNLPRFEHDPAVPIPPLGRLEPALTLAELDDDAHRLHITVNTLVRKRNQLVSTYRRLRQRLASISDG